MSADEDSDLEIIPNPLPKTKTVDLRSAKFDRGEHVATNIVRETNQSNSATKKCRVQIKSEPRSAPLKKKRKVVITDCKNAEHVKLVTNAIKPEPGAKCIDMRKQKVLSIGHNNFKFLTIRPGLNYAGRCVNTTCTAHNELVMVSRGFGVIDPLKDIQDRFMKCPGCSAEFALAAIELCRANASIEYHLVGEVEAIIKTCLQKSNFSGSWPIGVCLPGIFSESELMGFQLAPVFVSCGLSFILLLCATFCLYKELRAQKENQNAGVSRRMQDLLIRFVFYGVMVLSCLTLLAFTMFEFWFHRDATIHAFEQIISCQLRQTLLTPELNCNEHAQPISPFYFLSWPAVALLGIAAQNILSCHNAARRRLKNMVHFYLPKSPTLEIQMSDHMEMQSPTNAEATTTTSTSMGSARLS